MSYSDDIYRLADICRADPAYMMGISHALKESGLGVMLGWTPPAPPVEGPPPAFPSSDKITVVQSSIFDNWPQGKPVKGIPSRYGIAVEIWTKEANKVVIAKGRKPNFDFKSQSAVMDANNLKRQVADIRRKSRRVPVDEGYLDTLENLANTMGPDWRVAMLNTNIADDKTGYDRGRYYHAHQFMLIEMDGSNVVAAKMVLGEDDVISLAPFSDRDVAGNGLPPKVVGQSRHAACELINRSWATNEL